MRQNVTASHLYYEKLNNNILHVYSPLQFAEEFHLFNKQPPCKAGNILPR